MTISGLSRPIVGALSGLALFVLVKGGIVLPFLNMTPDTDQRLFFAGIAILAGFSERLLKDVLGNAGKTLKGDQEPSTARDDTNRPQENVATSSAD